ncbi:MAG: D-2-hydroxyacid dehydrogenase [Pleomorphochaeta sp.]
MNKINALVLVKLTKDEKLNFVKFEDKINFIYKDKEKVNITREDVESAEIIIGYPPRKYLKNAKNLKWLQMISSGVDKYLEKNVLPDNVVITNAKGSYGEAQSEFMFSLLLSLMKKIHLYRDNQQLSIWKDLGDVMVLRNSTALVVGLGDIGSEFAKILKAFNVKVIGIRRDITKEVKYVDEVHSFTEIDKYIPQADIVAMVIPSTLETQNLMNKDRINLMKKTAVLVNTGRGSTIDNEALCDAIENGKIAGAALDVFNPEPILPNHRAWKIENLIITPHAAGQDYMQHNWEKTLKLIDYNLTAYCDKKELKNIVDRKVYEFK